MIAGSSTRFVTTVFRITDAMAPALRNIAANAAYARAQVMTLTKGSNWTDAMGSLARRVVGDERSRAMMRDAGGRYTDSWFKGMYGSLSRGTRGLYQRVQAMDIPGTIRRAAGSAMSGAGSMLGMAGIGGGVLGLLGGGMAVAGITGVHSQFEETNNALAGMFVALGESGDFNQGLAMASTTMDAINIAAAKLPGEAEDYIAVFRGGLPVLRNAMPTVPLEDIYKFTNQMTAIGATFGVQSELMAGDLQDLFAMGQGHASVMRTQMFRQMQPYLRSLRGEANVTAESFNKLTAPQRIQMFKNAFHSLDPMLQGAAHSFSAMSGALVSMGRMLVRMTTGGAFDAIKGVMGELNALFMDDQGKLTAFGAKFVQLGKIIGDAVGGALNKVGLAIRQLPSFLDRVGARVAASPITQQLGHIGARLYGAASRTLGSASGRSGALGAAGALAMGSPLGLALGPIAEFAQNTRAVNATMRPLLSIFDRLVGLAEPTVRVLGEMNNVVGNMLAGILPGLASGLAMIAAPLMDFAMGVVGVVSVVVSYLRPHLEGLATEFGGLLTALGIFISSQFRIMGPVLLNVVSLLGEYVVPALTGFVDILKWTIHQLAALLRWMGNGQNQAAERFHAGRAGMPSTTGRDGGANLMDQMRAAWTAASAANAQSHADAAARAANRHATPAARAGHQTHFHNNRFDIRQAFEAGFDPDRVAVSFVEDIERSVNNPLQSGLAPAYGLR